MSIAPLDTIPFTNPAERLRSWRHSKSMSSRVLATKIGLGLTAATVERIEAGELIPDDVRAERIGLVTAGAVVFGLIVEEEELADGGGGEASASASGGGGASLEAASPPRNALAAHRREALGLMPLPEPARGPGRPGFGLGRHADGAMGLILVTRHGVTALSAEDAKGMRADLDLVEALLDNPLLFGIPA